MKIPTITRIIVNAAKAGIGLIMGKKEKLKKEELLFISFFSLDLNTMSKVAEVLYRGNVPRECFKSLEFFKN